MNHGIMAQDWDTLMIAFWSSLYGCCYFLACHLPFVNANLGRNSYWLASGERREGGVRGANRFVTNSLKRMLQLALFRLWGESICEIQKHFRHADLINCPPGRVFTQCQVFRAVLTANCITNCCIIMFDYNANASYNSIKIGHTLNWPYYARSSTTCICQIQIHLQRRVYVCVWVAPPDAVALYSKPKLDA